MNRYALGVDLGGSKIAYALLAEDGQVSQRYLEPTRSEEGPQAVIDRMAARIREILSQTTVDVAGIGIGAAGLTDSCRGVVLLASNLKWQNVPLRQKILDRLGAAWQNRIWVDKDTNAAALGEMYYGAGRGSKHILYVTVGTGIGGGMVLDGELYHGATEGASDIGHLILQADGPLCGCGHHGCLEALASGPAIAREAVQALKKTTGSCLSSIDPEKITAETVVDAARKGDCLALTCLENAGKWLGMALAYYININNPDRIIIGGGVGCAGDMLIEPARIVIEEQALAQNVLAVRLWPAGLKTDSGVIGAATLVWQNLKKG